jgi:Transposase DDE domain group 1
LNRLEPAPSAGPTRYHKVGHDPEAIERLFVDLFIEAHAKAPKQIILELDDPLHGHQEGRFFHGYYDCYCYLPLYVFCGRHLLAACRNGTRQAAAVEHRRQRRDGGGDRAPCDAYPAALAAHAHPAAGRLRASRARN